MAEYNGSIELIAGLKPKNNGDFPLVNAPDVLLTDGRRLSDIDFDNLGGSETFPVTFDVDPAAQTATCRVSFEEIASAVSDGKFVYGLFEYMGAPVRIPFMYIAENVQPFAAFEGTYELMGLKIILLAFADGTVEAQTLPISSGGGDSETPPVRVDLTRLDSDGVIEESYADGSVKTTTLEYDTTGNPVKITDGDGNVTELVW